MEEMETTEKTASVKEESPLSLKKLLKLDKIARALIASGIGVSVAEKMLKALEEKNCETVETQKDAVR